MARQLIIAVLLLLGLGAIHVAGTHRPRLPAPSGDPYAWLGPLPANLHDAGVGRRWERILDRMSKESRAVDVRRFVCRSPAEVGPLPLMKNVMRYVDRLPHSQDDELLAGDLCHT